MEADDGNRTCGTSTTRTHHATPTTATSTEATGAISSAAISRMVARGDSLWAISRHIYGDGSRYSLIFQANRGKINNPDLIYPGQVFVVPSPETASSE